MSEISEKIQKRRKIIAASVIAVVLAVFLGFFIWGWGHSYCADEAAYKAYCEVNDLVLSETKYNVSGAKKIVDSCFLKIVYDIEKKHFRFNILPRGLSADTFDEKKKHIKELADKGKILAKETDEYNRVLKILDLTSDGLDIHICEVDKELKHKKIDYKHNFVDDFFCCLRGSDATQMNNAFEGLIVSCNEMMEKKTSVCLIIVAEEKQMNFYQIQSSNEKKDGNKRFFTFKTHDYMIGDKKNKATMVNVLQYGVYFVEKFAKQKPHDVTNESDHEVSNWD
ncbi:hypothetical protein EDEG_03410 [Edhazardia aedis USNM 41457]|uniref:Uncharacterized protein n=1 Tax=Edhazardia aedis (strain USNM 41457) TaxID=1003232 RepID=J9DLA9_EDHAE|nr:hypothetical protein EDEG_03410 [Edhazardia aedis USNM 41457]|eukprot:EJW02142.1 hypothetical protein EDEG_03410 [Edhazardia aedis USNM 41457]